VIGFAGAACAGEAAPSPPATVSPVAPSTTPTVTSPAPPSSPTGSPAGSIALDESLLAVLPPDLGGLPVQPEPGSFAEVRDDPELVRTAEAIAFAIVVDPVSGDLASGAVVRLRPGAFADAMFRAWRDSYDEGACGQAGGVTGRAETTLGGRTVYITSCAEGLRAYHAHLPGPDRLVSLFSIGERRLGEQLMADLRP
jgi:hypothetical protein